MKSVQLELDFGFTPIIDYYNGWYDIAQIACLLKINGLTRNGLYKFLRAKLVLLPDNRPYPHYLDNGYCDVRIKTISDQNGGIKKYTYKPLFSPKGIIFIKTILKQRHA